MNKLISRKIKKCYKNATLVYNKECTLMYIQFKYKQNTKWKRKAVSLINKEEKSKIKKIEEVWKTLHETIKRNNHDNKCRSESINRY